MVTSLHYFYMLHFKSRTNEQFSEGKAQRTFRFNSMNKISNFVTMVY
jgi:hypothetical protein